MKFVFRTDSSFEIGTGHVIRCLTLAKELRNREVECVFVCREHDGHLIEKILQEGFRCIALNKYTETHEIKDTDGPVLAHAKWLGVAWLSDAQETIRALEGKKFDWLVVDHYALDMHWEGLLRPHVKNIMVIDDLADRSHDCDLLLDQNLIANFETRYQNIVPEHCIALLGPQYSLLQPEYAFFHQRTPPRSGPIKNILIFFGGVDQFNLTGRTLSAFLKLNRYDIKLNLVVTSCSPHWASIQGQVQQHANINIYSELPTLSHLLIDADYSIGASGATSWERCCLGVPSLIITITENQKPIAEELDEQGLVRWLGHYDAVTDDMLLEALQTAIDDKDLESRSLACMTVADGNGVKRVASYLMLNAKTKLMARLACLNDEMLLLRWVSDPLFSHSDFNPKDITTETHRRWFYSRLRNHERCKIYIVQTIDGMPLGQIRFEYIKNAWVINYSLTSIVRERELTRNVLKIALKAFRAENNGPQVFASVKQSNGYSQKIFDELGLPSSEGGKLSIAICSDSKSWINEFIPELFKPLFKAIKYFAVPPKFILAIM